LNELGKKETLSWQPRSMDGIDDLDGDGDEDDDDDDMLDEVPRGPGGSVQGGLNLLQQQRQIEVQRRQFLTGGADRSIQSS